VVGRLVLLIHAYFGFYIVIWIIVIGDSVVFAWFIVVILKFVIQKELLLFGSQRRWLLSEGLLVLGGSLSKTRWLLAKRIWRRLVWVLVIGIHVLLALVLKSWLTFWHALLLLAVCISTIFFSLFGSSVGLICLFCHFRC